jgi:hypothetical protein
MPNRSSNKTKRFFLLLVLAAAIFLAATQQIDRAISYLGMGKVAQSNEQYLNDSFDQAVSGFLILSAIKSGLAVIEGSEVGVGFNLELGDVVQSVYDYVDVAWQTALLGGTVILVTRLLIQAVGMLDHWFLTLALASLVLFLLFRWLAPGKRRLSRVTWEMFFFLNIFAVVFYIVFPFAIAGASFLSERITKPLIEESQNSFESIKDDFSIGEIQRKILSEDQERDSAFFFDFGIRSRFERTKSLLSEWVDYLQQKTRNIAIWTIQLIAGYLFDSVLFPLIFFLLLYFAAKSILIYIMEDRQKQSLGSEIRELISKLFNQSRTEPPHQQSRRSMIRRRAAGSVRRTGIVPGAER